MSEQPLDTTGFPQFNDIPAVFDCKTLAQILGVSRSTARNVMHSRGFPKVVIGQSVYRVYKPAFLKWLKDQSVARV